MENLKVLVVDDSKTMLRIIQNVLMQLKLKKEYIITAENGKEALDLFKKENFDFILTDWNMPVMNGLELIKNIRKNNQNIPIIMITTEGGKAQVITALKAGANQYIIKPFTPITLKEKLNDILIN